ncbi:MAG: GNAT family N-acetyltransferase [Thermoplasmata archaeon]|nr:GNAT family N-acetyltransferase [Thermoplasmata archaeon]
MTPRTRPESSLERRPYPSSRRASRVAPLAPRDIRIEPMVDHPSALESVVGWQWAEFGFEDPGGSAAEWCADLLATFSRDEVPLGYLAMEGDQPVGSSELIEHDLRSRRDLTPWLAGVIVRPDLRGCGVGRRLVRTVESKAADLGFSTIYCFTESAAPFYRKLGWTRFGSDRLYGHRVTILRREV